MKIFDISNSFTTVFGYSLSYVECIATVFGLLSVWLSTRQIIWTWATGLINIAFSFVIFYQVQLYADMFLQVYFFVTYIYGWVTWKNEFRERKPVKKLSNKTRVLLFLLVMISTFVFGSLVKNVHLILPMTFAYPASFPFIDTFIAVVSIIGTILLARRVIDNWVLWLIVDIMAMFVYALKNIMFISFVYAVFCVLASLGMFSWLKSTRNDRILSIAPGGQQKRTADGQFL